MILLMNSDITSERFILSSENIPYQKVFAEAAECFGKKPPEKKLLPFLLKWSGGWKHLKIYLRVNKAC